MAKRVLPEEAAALMGEGWTYLDVRSVPEFAEGHPKGAVNVPLLNLANGRMSPNAAFLEVVQANYPKDTKLIVGCKSGGRSLQASSLLEAAGYTALVDVRGGFAGEADGLGRVTVKGWSDAGLPVDREPVPGASYEALSTRRA